MCVYINMCTHTHDRERARERERERESERERARERREGERERERGREGEREKEFTNMSFFRCSSLVVRHGDRQFPPPSAAPDDARAVTSSDPLAPAQRDAYTAMQGQKKLVRAREGGRGQRERGEGDGGWWRSSVCVCVCGWV